MDDIIRMAREAGIDAEKDTLCRYEGWVEPLARFAALVRADERERIKAEPVQPVAGVVLNEEGRAALVEYGREEWHCVARNARRLYTAPPKAEPLPLKTVERLIYENTKINPNVADDRELLGYIVNAVRAVERAHGIGDNA